MPKLSRQQKTSRPVNPLVWPRFSGITSFNRLPIYHPDLNPSCPNIGIIGVPFDGGTTFRPGARFAPRSIREASVLTRNYHPDLHISPYENLTVMDLGDVLINPLSIEKSFQSIEESEFNWLQKGTHLLSFGGDHSILLPELRAFTKLYPHPIIVQIDAHTDTADQAWGEKYHHGTPIRRAIEEKLIRGSDVFQIGIRGGLTSPSQEDYTKKEQIQILDMTSFDQPQKKDRFIKHLIRHAKHRPVFITFDVDGVDPAFTPGTGTPVPGGLTSREAFSIIRSLKGLNIRGGNIVEVAPAYDYADMTSLFAACMGFEIMSLMAHALKK